MNWFGEKRIFLDYAGGRRNPSGIHKEGREARWRLEEARLKMAGVLHCQARDVIFTSGATESDNLAVLGAFEAYRQTQERPHVIISDREHPAVYEAAREAERRGAELTVVPAAETLSYIKETTVLISVAYASNETGALQDAARLARRVRELRRERGRRLPYFHTDATAAYAYAPVDADRLPADLITLDDILVVRGHTELRPLLWGGGQERGLRSGTENIEAIECSVLEFEDAARERESRTARLEKLKKLFLSEISRVLPEAVINTPEKSLPHIVSLSFPGKLHEFLAVKLDEAGVGVSTGSSCDSRKDEPDKEALRFSFSPETSESDVREAVRILRQVVL